MEQSKKIYNQINFKRNIVLCVSAIAVLVMIIVDLGIGSSSLGFLECIRLIFRGPGAEGNYTLIVWQMRLPMTLTCVGVGGCLAISGLQVQTITNNPLSSPYTLGISSGASFGAAIAIVCGISVFNLQWVGTALVACLFALFVTAMIFALGKLKRMSAQTLVLVGIIMNFFFSALQQYLQYRANAEIAQIIANWNFGNLSRSSWTSAAVSIGAMVIGVLFFARLSWPLTTFNAGEERAKSLGVMTEKLKITVFLISAVLIAASVGFIGTVGFVGLVAPHCARLLVGEDQRYLMPVSALFGMLVMLVASSVSKLISEGSMLPVGIITSVVGVPFLFVLLIREVK